MWLVDMRQRQTHQEEGDLLSHPEDAMMGVDKVAIENLASVVFQTSLKVHISVKKQFR